jgi:hypothetical protein
LCSSRRTVSTNSHYFPLKLPDFVPKYFQLHLKPFLRHFYQSSTLILHVISPMLIFGCPGYADVMLTPIRAAHNIRPLTPPPPPQFSYSHKLSRFSNFTNFHALWPQAPTTDRWSSVVHTITAAAMLNVSQCCHHWKDNETNWSKRANVRFVSIFIFFIAVRISFQVN